MKLVGTLEELLIFVPWEELSRLTGVGYYNQCLVGKDEIFQVEYPPKVEEPKAGYYWATAPFEDVVLLDRTKE